MNSIHMKWKMLFRIGVTIVVVVGIIVFYLNNRIHDDGDTKLSKLLEASDFAFKESFKHQLNEESKALHTQDGVEGRDGGTDQRGANRKQSPGRQQSRGTAERAIPVEKSRHSGGPAVTIDPNLRDGGQGISANKVAGGETRHRESNDEASLGLKPHYRSESKTKSEASLGLKSPHRRVGIKMKGKPTATTIYLCVVVCGDRSNETLVLLKSAVLLTPHTPLVLLIFAERQLHDVFKLQLDFWPVEIQDTLEYRIYDTVFPSDDQEKWKMLFKKCASQRLFLPELLTDVDSLVYVDTDILFVSSLRGLWDVFFRFDSHQLVALAPEHEDSAVGWYNRFALHPYVLPLGVNSGVMLMNLTRLRQTSWQSLMLKYYNKYFYNITFGDQDLINIYFHFFPEQLYQFGCEWNYRPDHCMYMSVCKAAEHTGAYVLHGSRRTMHNDKQPAFKAVYQAFQLHQFWEDMEKHMLPRVKKNLIEVRNSACGRLPHIFITQIENFVKQNRIDVTKTQGKL